MNGKELLMGLSHIDQTLIQESEMEGKRTKGTLRRPLLVAAMVALMLFLVGCAAVVLLHLEDLRIREEHYTANMYYLEDGGTVPAGEKTMHVISTVGAQTSKNHQALMEWLAFTQTCDPAQDGAEDYEKPEIYCDYPVYNQEMEDFLRELLDKYGLKPTGKAENIQAYRENDEALFHEILGIRGISLENSDLALEFGGCRFNECGNFSASYNASLGEHEFTLIYQYHNKAYFGTNYLMIEDGDAVQQWNYTCQDGTELLIVNEKGEDTHILCDREDGFITVTVKNVGPDWESPGDVMTKQELEQIAQSLDYSLAPQPVSDMESAGKRIAESREAYENQDWSAGEAERVKEYNEHEHHATFAQLIACMRDKEDYFTSKKSGGYENFWETMEFTLRDITGDGQEELILGKKGVIYAVWTIRDGVTACLDGTYPEGYLCEGNVIEHYAFLDGQHFHHYRKPTNDGYCTKLLDVEYHRTEGTWILNESQDGSGWEEISEEKAMEIIGRYPRLELDMKPVKEFPME